VNTTVDLTSLPSLTAGFFAVRLIEIGDTQADGAGDTGGAGTFRIADFFVSAGNTLDVQFNGTITNGGAVPEVSTFVVWMALIVGVCVCRKQCFATK
jgi:hypothetical protein